MSKRKKQTGRYVVEINDWGCGTMIKDTLTGKEIDAPAEETVNLCLAEMNRLAAEVERLRASSFVTAVPVEQYERVIKAGDAMADALNLNDDVFDNKEKKEAQANWNAAKECKGHP